MGLMDLPPSAEDQYKNMNWRMLNIISREGWGALPPTSEEPFDSHPVNPMVMGYTETPQCNTKSECIKMMQELQKKHMAEGMSDIRYSFVVGGDLNVYEGRGFLFKTGAHYRYPELNGNNAELVISGTRGTLPDAQISAMMWRLQDQGVWDGFLDVMPTIYQDYIDPQPPIDDSELEVTGGVSALDWLDGKVPKGVFVPNC